MTNVEIQMSKECRNPKPEPYRHLSFGLLSSFGFRHSTLRQRVEVFLQKLLKILPMNLLRFGEVNP